jgi:SAM-dependent methyltransferase
VRVPVPPTETRTSAELREHYEIERELADRLRAADRDQRLQLYSSVYDELFRRVPHHPQNTWRRDPSSRAWVTERLVRLLAPLLRSDSTFLEIGAGDCTLSTALAPLVAKVYAVDVSEEITAGLELPANVEVVISNGCNISVPAETVSLAFSANLMEHLHPDDALDQLNNIRQALAKGGKYVCITPNRLGGPHDISRFFDDTATGLHLKEYTVGELARLFKSVGFSQVFLYVGGRGRYFRSSAMPVRILEGLLDCLPDGLRMRLAGHAVVSGLLGVRIVGVK